MERPNYFKQPLSPAGEKRLRMAEKIHSALWQYLFKGQSAVQRPGRTQHETVEYRLPRIEQILDFVRRYVGLRLKDGTKCTGIEVAIPASRPHTEHYALCATVPLPEQFAIEDCNEN